MLRLPCYALMAFGTAVAVAQTQSAPPTPRDYRGVSVTVDGIFVTPVPNAPFSADVQILSHQVLSGGGERVVTTRNHIARSSSGRIHNEMRRLVPATFQGEPHLRSVHLYDPSTRLNIFYDPDTLVARQTTLPAPMRTPARALAPEQQPAAPDLTVTPLGEQQFEGLTLQGTRKTRVISAELSGTGQPVTITDEYWYSPELSIYLTIKHNDPRTGEQIVAVTKLERTEPPAEMMSVPPSYKVVDETPPPRPAIAASSTPQ